MIDTLPYWLALTAINNSSGPRERSLTTARKNSLYIAAYQHKPRFSIGELFTQPELWAELGCTAAEGAALRAAAANLAHYQAQCTAWLEQGYSLIPLHDPRYPPALKRHMKRRSPTLLFTWGEVALLQQPMRAIVGTRVASEISLSFTDQVARQAAQCGEVIVSGFAHGIDQRALNATLACGGRSIIVLPQGITSARAQLRPYEDAIAAGQLLVFSSYEPEAPWATWRALNRNKIIYGLAKTIYIAQSNDHGGTWSGAQYGLSEGRTIYVRRADRSEACANNALIAQGAHALDSAGRPA